MGKTSLDLHHIFCFFNHIAYYVSREVVYPNFFPIFSARYFINYIYIYWTLHGAQIKSDVICHICHNMLVYKTGYTRLYHNEWIWIEPDSIRYQKSCYPLDI